MGTQGKQKSTGISSDSSRLGWRWGPTLHSQKHTNKQGFPCRAPSFSSVCAWAPCLLQHMFLALFFQFYPKERSRWTRQLTSHFNTVTRPTWPTRAAGLRTPACFISYQAGTAHAALTFPAVLMHITRGDQRGWSNSPESRFLRPDRNAFVVQPETPQIQQLSCCRC